ncbi:MAG: glycoside hydrolase family 127 protein [Cyclobacteriaceae bacterium]
MEKFSLHDVRLLESPFLAAQNADMEYMLSLDADRILAPYLIDAGIPTDTERYPNWENSGLDGHTGGHLLSALAMMYASTGDKEVFERLNYMIDQLEMCQEKNGNGYVGGVPGGQEIWEEISRGNINAGNFSLNHKWVPLYNIHKLYAGLRDAYLIGEISKAKPMLIALTDWMIDVTKDLTDEQVQEMLISEHGGLNEVFADVYAITGDRKYMDLAHRFSDRRILDPLLHEEDVLTGMHANTQIPKVIGYNRIGILEGDEEWISSARYFWGNVTEKRTVSIGGNSVREHFNPVDGITGYTPSPRQVFGVV